MSNPYIFFYKSHHTCQWLHVLLHTVSMLANIHLWLSCDSFERLGALFLAPLDLGCFFFRSTTVTTCCNANHGEVITQEDRTDILSIDGTCAQKYS